jgi:hypothetical protein
MWVDRLLLRRKARNRDAPGRAESEKALDDYAPPDDAAPPEGDAVGDDSSSAPRSMRGEQQ